MAPRAARRRRAGRHLEPVEDVLRHVDIADIRRFDQLGPLTREVIRHSPKDIQVGDFLPAFMQTRANAIGLADDMDAAAAAFDANRDELMAKFLLERIKAKFPDWPGPI